MKKLNFLIVIVLFSVWVVACGQGNSPGAADEGNERSEKSVNLTFAVTFEDAGIDQVIRETFEEKIHDLSDGTIEVDFFMGGQLGGEREILEQMKLGEIDMGYTTLHSELYYPKYNATHIPFLFPDLESIKEFKGGPMGEEIDRLLLENGGVVSLGIHDYGPRWTTSNKPFKTPEELDGIKIRLPEIKWWVDVWEEMGALPTPIAATEIITALQTGVVDAQENFLGNVVSRQLWETQKHLIKTEHIRNIQEWLISEMTWDELNEEQREIIQQAVEETTSHIEGIVDDYNEEFIDEALANGMELIEVDQEAFREAAMPAIEKIIDEELASGVYDEVLKSIGEER